MASNLRPWVELPRGEMICAGSSGISSFRVAPALGSRSLRGPGMRPRVARFRVF